MLGREVRLPTEIMFGLGTSHVGETVASYSEFVDHLKSRMQRAYELARSHLGVVAEREKWKHDFKLNLKRYHQGNLVWVRTDKNQLHITPKLRCAYQIPYLVLHRVNDLDYVIQLDAEGKGQLTHHGRLKPYEGQVRLLSGPKRHPSSTGTQPNIPWIKWWMNDWVIHVTYLVHPWFQFPNCVKVNSEDNCLWIRQEKAVLLMQWVPSAGNKESHGGSYRAQTPTWPCTIWVCAMFEEVRQERSCSSTCHEDPQQECLCWGHPRKHGHPRRPHRQTCHHFDPWRGSCSTMGKMLECEQRNQHRKT